MSKIGRIYSAIYSATSDRYFITKASKKKNLDRIEQNLRIYVEKTSGPSTDNLVEAVKRWKKAYNAGIERIKQKEAINNQFKEPSVISKIIRYITK